MEVNLANEILKVMDAGGYEVPQDIHDDARLIDEAEFYLRHARAAVEAGEADDTIKKIIRLADAESESSLGKERDNPSRKTSEEPDSAPARLAKENNLPIPPEIQGEAHILPRDLTTLSPRDVRKLSGEYNAILARTNWEQTIAQSDLANFSHLRDDRYQSEFLILKRKYNLEGAKVLKDELEFEARTHPDVIDLELKVREAEERVRVFKALSEIYSRNVDRLSREWTMRQDEGGR